MFSKIAVLPVAATLLEQANAFSFHRHQQAHVEKRDIITQTVLETVYVTAGNEPAQTQPAFVQDSQPAPAVQTVTVDATPAQAPPPPPQQQAEQAPAPAQTTLATAVKPAWTIPGLGNLLPTKASSSSAPAGTSDSGLAGKRGIAYNDPQLANSFKKGCKYCRWAYNWGSDAAGLDDSVQYIPLLWGDLPVHTNQWHSNAQAAVSKGVPALLSFNEPDMPSQANMGVAAAVAAHAKYFAPYVGKTKIGSPAVSNSGQPGQGLAWLKDWVAGCNADSNCSFDFCVVHWYSEAQYSETLFTHLKDANDACQGKPIWLTEFAPFGDDAAKSSFMKSVIPRLEALDYLHAYSYFMVAQNQLMSSNSLLSTIGNVYAAIAGN